MPNLTKFQKDILDSLYDHSNLNTRESLFAGVQENHEDAKISKAMVADYVRDRKKSKTTFVEQVSEDPVVTEKHEPEKKHLYNPSTGFYLDSKFDEIETHRLVDLSKLVDCLYNMHKVQKLGKENTDKKTPRGLVDLITEQKTDELLQLFFNITLASINSILTNDTMRDDLLRALDIKDIQDDISLLNKGVFGSEEEKEEAKLEYELQHDESEASNDEESDESEDEEEQEIETHKVKKVQHRLINTVEPFEVKTEEVSDIRSGIRFV